MFRPSRVVLILLLNVCSLAATYSALGIHRWRGQVMIDDRANYPRPLPYPDTLLLRLENWYDVRFPCPPGYFKVEGEHSRVMMTLWVWFGVFALASALWLWLLTLPWLMRWLGYIASPPPVPIDLSPLFGRGGGGSQLRST